jgi:hypothetical protein
MTAMAVGVPSLFYMQQMFWAFVGTAIGVAAIANVLNMIIFRQRMSASRQNIATPSKPRSFIFRCHASLIHYYYLLARPCRKPEMGLASARDLGIRLVGADGIGYLRKSFSLPQQLRCP